MLKYGFLITENLWIYTNSMLIEKDNFADPSSRNGIDYNGREIVHLLNIIGSS
jgi:hypothetical protein